MSKYDTWNWADSYPDPISADEGTICNRLLRNEIVAQAPSVSDLISAIQWLALYDGYDNTDENIQAFTNVIAFLSLTIDSKNMRSALNQAKRVYAQQNNVKFNQVRKMKVGK